MKRQIQESAVIDGRAQWNAYLARIRRFADPEDRVAIQITRDKLFEVQRALDRRRGVVVKRDHAPKALNSELWKQIERWTDSWLKRHGIHSTLGLPEKTYNMYAGYAVPYDDTGSKFLNPRYRFFDVHHIWPEALGGCSEGWNLIPLPKDRHLYVLHPMIDKLVRQSPPGMRIRLI